MTTITIPRELQDVIPSDRELYLARKAVEGNAWRLAALRVGVAKFRQLPPVGYYDWSPQEWCDWAMAQTVAGKSA